jgi:hypothetical protein
MKIKTTGKSLVELYKEYGTGSAGFYSTSPWWIDEAFAKEKPEAGEYEIELGKGLVDLTFDEQKKKINKDFEVIHPAILVEAILSHFKETGERLLENKYDRTSSLDSDGDRVYVGRFDASGLHVGNVWGYTRHDEIGVASARKLKIDSCPLDTFDSPLTLESAVKMCVDNGYVVYKQVE